MRTTRTTLVWALAAALALTACTNTSTFPGGSEYTPLVDMQGHDPIVYKHDVSQCREYARQISVADEAGSGAIAGTIGGALIGALLGAASGGRSMVGYGAQVGGAYGLVGGGVRGAAGAWKDQASVIRNCLAGRGYNVLR